MGKDNIQQINAPTPITNNKELDSLDKLTLRYEKLIEPSKLSKVGKSIVEKTPEKLKVVSKNFSNGISEQEIYTNTLKIIADGFKVIEEQAAKFSIPDTVIIKKVNETTDDFEISEIEQICFTRSYDIAKIVNSYKSKDLAMAFVEGATTGVAGFWGLPFNIVLSTFLYFRAVQSIATFYGYDVKNNSDEMIIASQVFVNSMSPSQNDINNEFSSIISKVMLMTQASVISQTSKKTWTDMATRGGVCLVLTQMRALAHKSAQKALEKAGAKGLENSVFKEVFEQIGKRLTLKVVQKSVPVVSGVLGALIDTAQMKTIVEFADVFYQKRFIVEKEARIYNYLEDNKYNDIIDL